MRKQLLTVMTALVMGLVFASDSLAMYHPKLGRFMQRDMNGQQLGPSLRIGTSGHAPGGSSGFLSRDRIDHAMQYADGMSLNAAHFVMQGAVDPSGNAIAIIPLLPPLIDLIGTGAVIWGGAELFQNFTEAKDECLPAGQKCRQKTLDKLNQLADQFCHDDKFSCTSQQTIDQNYANLSKAKACRDARNQRQNQCFTPKHPEWEGHQEALNGAQGAVNKCLRIIRRQKLEENSGGRYVPPRIT